MERRYNIAVAPGDGIGPEVVEGAVHVLKALMCQDPELKMEEDIAWNLENLVGPQRFFEAMGLEIWRTHEKKYILGTPGD